MPHRQSCSGSSMRRGGSKERHFEALPGHPHGWQSGVVIRDVTELSWPSWPCGERGALAQFALDGAGDGVWTGTGAGRVFRSRWMAMLVTCARGDRW